MSPLGPFMSSIRPELSRPVSTHGSGRYANAESQSQLRGNPGFTPGWTLLQHHHNQERQLFPKEEISGNQGRLGPEDHSNESEGFCRHLTTQPASTRMNKNDFRVMDGRFYSLGRMVCRPRLWRSKELILKDVHFGRRFCAPQPCQIQCAYKTDS